jgi:2-keto-4-pentenoate hydratase/2-oxohepta-3-ene-1,7-dioic acid hydratase in catechol pathway
VKLLRYEGRDRVKLGVLDDAGVVPISDVDANLSTMQSVIAGGDAALRTIRNLVTSCATRLPLNELKLRSPVERPGKYLAIGLNYRKHVEESKRLGVAAPEHQLWFNKQTSCLAGPYDDIDPGVTEKLDYEVELAVVIGKRAKHVGEADAHEHVFGYCVANDVSARDWQFHSPTFTVGKSFDTHGPVGPWIVTADEVVDPHRLPLRCFVNGEVRQQSDTSQMIFNIWQQISYLSTAFTLEPGDLLATGTPEGVGVGMQPPCFLRAGDVVRCEVEGIGAIENKVKETVT